MGSEPRLTAFLLPQETFHYQINIEKSPPPTQQHHALTLSGWVAELEGSKCWAQVGSCRPRETEAQAPRAGWGYGEGGAWAALLLLARGGPIFSRWGN